MCMFICTPKCRGYTCKCVGYMHSCAVSVCVCALRGGCTVLSHAAGIEWRVQECACHCSKWGKKEKRVRKRSAVKVAEAHKRKERDRENLLSLIRVSASPSSFGEPKHEHCPPAPTPPHHPTPTFTLFKNIFFSLPSQFFHRLYPHYACTPFCFFIFYVPSVIQFVSQKDRGIAAF